MTQIARYVIVLDRYDDDDEDYLVADTGHGLNDGTEDGGCAQVAAELQAAMEQLGTPAGFFNVIAREVWIAGADHTNVSQADPVELREPTAAMLLKPERTQGPPPPDPPMNDSAQDRVYVITSRDGPQYTRVHATRASVLSQFADYLADTPEVQPHVDAALSAAELGEVGDLGDGDRIQVLPVQP